MLPKLVWLVVESREGGIREAVTLQQAIEQEAAGHIDFACS